MLTHILRRIENLGLPVVAQLQPGLSTQAIEHWQEQLPFALPTEVCMYYEWRNGYQHGLPRYDLLFPAGRVLSLESAINDYYKGLVKLEEQLGENMLHQQMLPDTAALSYPYNIFVSPTIWHKNWLPVFDDISNGYHIIIGNSQKQATTPIYFIWLEDGIYLAYDSLTSLLETVATAYEMGAYYLDTEGYVCKNRAKLLPIVNHYNPRRREYLLYTAGDAKTLEDLVKALASSDNDIAANATRALFLLGDASVVELLIDQLRHEQPRARQLAARVLGELGEQRAIHPLLHTAAKDPDKFVRQYAKYALRELNSA